MRLTDDELIEELLQVAESLRSVPNLVDASDELDERPSDNFKGSGHVVLSEQLTNDVGVAIARDKAEVVLYARREQVSTGMQGYYEAARRT